MSTPNNEILIEYEKNSSYKNMHCDGVIGGWTTHKLLLIDFFTEKRSHPKTITYEAKNGIVNPTPIRRTGFEGVLREIEGGIIMDYKILISLRDWLNKRIDEFPNLENPEKP